MFDWPRQDVAEWAAALADVTDGVERVLSNLQLLEPLSTQMDHLEGEVREVFHGSPDILFQRFLCRGGLQGLAIFDKSMVGQGLMIRGVLDRLAGADLGPDDGPKLDLLGRVAQRIAPVGACHTVHTLGELSEHVLDGSVICAFAGAAQALAADVEKLEKRAIAEAPSSPAVFGPHDGFIEDAETNISLVRRRLRTPRLWVEQLRLGTLSRTVVNLIYLNGVADDLIVGEVRARLRGIKVDGILESHYIVDLIRDAPRSPFPTLQRTERPDRVAAGLLEGQVAIITDGSPFAILAPTTLARLMRADEDYYQNWYVSTSLRLIRLVAIGMGVFLPGLFVAISTFHQEFIPTPLLTILATSKENVALPTLLEILMLLLLFEIIREASTRVPKGIANALTIGGTLVVGEAAVRAGIVSSPAIIVVAAVVIAFFAIPNYDLVQITRFTLYPILIASGFLGIYGMFFAGLTLFLYLASLRSFGVPYLAPFAPIVPRDWNDFMLRAPRWAMNTRPAGTGHANPIRQAPNQKPHPPRAGRR